MSYLNMENTQIKYPQWPKTGDQSLTSSPTNPLQRAKDKKRGRKGEAKGGRGRKTERNPTLSYFINSGSQLPRRKSKASHKALHNFFTTWFPKGSLHHHGWPRCNNYLMSLCFLKAYTISHYPLSLPGPRSLASCSVMPYPLLLEARYYSKYNP